MSAAFLECLRESKEGFVVEVRGNSMFPALRDGEKARIVADGRRLLPGDLVAFFGGDGSLWIHRLLIASSGREGGLQFRTRGDANFEVDSPVSAERLAGRVVSRFVGEREIPISGFRNSAALIRHHFLPLLTARFLRLILGGSK